MTKPKPTVCIVRAIAWPNETSHGILEKFDLLSGSKMEIFVVQTAVASRNNTVRRCQFVGFPRLNSSTHPSICLRCSNSTV